MASNPLSLYRDLFEQSSEGMIISDRNGKIGEANEAAAEIFGYDSREELLERSIPNLVPKPKRETHKEQVETYFHEPSRRRMGKGRDVEGVRKDGSLFPAEISLNHFSMENGENWSSVLSPISRIGSRTKRKKTYCFSRPRKRNGKGSPRNCTMGSPNS